MNRCPLFRAGLAAAVALLILGRTPAGAAEFRPLFNGRDLTGWEGDRRFWSVSGGMIRGETTLARMAPRNTFLIWRGGGLGDFELTLKVRLRNGNSGVQYRSRDLGRFVVAGYQAEIDNAPGKAGFLYEEKGRKFLARIGEKVEMDAAGKPLVVGRLAGKEELLAQKYYQPRAWNDYRIVARGPRLQHFLNGIPIVEVRDDDPARRSLAGLLALQIHIGPPMLVEFKDILLKEFPRSLPRP